MPRPPRSIFPGQPHHIIARGNNRCATFVGGEDVAYSLNCLRAASVKFHCSVHSYVIMTNHLHLLVTPENESAMPDFMQSFKVRYVRYFNRKNRRTGALWEERYFSELIDTERYFFECSRYIELNPVRAGMVSDPAEHAGSSFGRNAHGRADALVTPHPLYQALASTSAERTSKYRSFFNGFVDKPDPEDGSDDGRQSSWRWL